MLTLALTICIAAIFCFFAEEFTSIFKRIFAIRWMPLFLPLAAASWFVFTYDYLVLWGLFYIRDVLNHINSFFVGILPLKQYSADIVLVILLTVFSVGPVIILNFLSYRKTNQPYQYPYLLSTLLWIIGAIVLVSLPALYNQV